MDSKDHWHGNRLHKLNVTNPLTNVTCYDTDFSARYEKTGYQMNLIGKYMVEQHILPGRFCGNQKDCDHLKYPDYCHYHKLWLFSGIRLAENIAC